MGKIKTWTNKEIKKLKDLYESNLVIKEVYKNIFPDRSLGMIKYKAKSLGLTRMNKWTDSDIELLKNTYSTKTKDELLNLFPDRDMTGLRQMASKLGINRTRDDIWTIEELEKLKHLYESGLNISENYKKYLPNRTRYSIIGKAAELNMSDQNRWTDEELEILKELYPLEGPSGLLEKLPNRNYDTIAAKANQLGIVGPQAWSDEEISVIEGLYENGQMGMIQELLPNRSLSSVHHKGQRLGLIRDESFQFDAGKKYDINSSLFENELEDIDDCVLFGYFLADGSRTRNQINFSSIDETYLQKVKLKFEYEGKLHERNIPSDFSTSNEKTQYSLKIKNRHIAKRIAKMVPYSNKTENLVYPDINIPYELDFIRGFFEGDGSIWCDSKTGQSYGFSIISPLSFAEVLQDKLIDLIIVDGTKKLNKVKLGKHNTKYMRYVHYGGNLNVSAIGYYLYASVFAGKSNIFMTRKVNKFIDLWSLRNYLPPNELLDIYGKFIKDGDIQADKMKSFINELDILINLD